MSTTAAAVLGPDVLRDILREAWRPGAAEPVAVHVRPEVHGLISGPDRPTAGWSAGVRLVVDDDIPAFPGFEVHRAAPGPTAMTASGDADPRHRSVIWAPVLPGHHDEPGTSEAHA